MNITDIESSNINTVVNKLCENVIGYKAVCNITDHIPDMTDLLLLGENTHGTKEFYNIRADITKHMIQYKNYKVILLEAEWPDIIRVNEYIHGNSQDISAKEAFENIKKFPEWMWKNEVIYELIEWLKKYNEHNIDDPVYIFGIDCQQFLDSTKFVINYLQKTNSGFYETAKNTLSGLNNFSSEREYANSAVYGSIKPHVNNIVHNLQDFLSSYQWDHADAFLNNPLNNISDKLDVIYCEQSLEILVNGEEYFRKMLEEPAGSNASWNTRDQHMLMTIMRIRNRFSQLYNNVTPKIIVWAHNSHIGNSNATSGGGDSFTHNNTWNVGQMVKEMFENTISIGMYTDNGYVTAGTGDCNYAIRQQLQSSNMYSYEYLFHKTILKLSVSAFVIDLRQFRQNTVVTGDTDGDTDVDTTSDNKFITGELYRNVSCGTIFKAIKYTVDNNKVIQLYDENNVGYTAYSPYGNVKRKCYLVNRLLSDNLSELFNSTLLQRMIGIKYIPETELDSHYGESKLSQQYDMVLFVDSTTSIV